MTKRVVEFEYPTPARGKIPSFHSIEEEAAFWDTHDGTDFLDESLETAVDQFRRTPSPLSVLLIEHLGGAVARVGRDETAFDYRDADYNLIMLGRWADPAQADENIAWTRGLSEARRRHARGVYVNYLGVEEQGDRVRAAYGDEKYTRLVELKNRYDPTNRFCFNQNIKPTVTA